MLPLKTSISDTYPNPSNATARAGFAALWDAINEFQQKSELDVASAATCDIGGQLSTKLRITGTTGITSFGTNYRGPIMLRFAGVVTLTHNSTTLVCPGSSNLTTAAGDVLIAWPIASVSGTLDGWQVAVLARGNGGAIFVTGPTAPTAAVNTNTTQLATTAFVIAQLKAGPAFAAAHSVSQSLSSAVSTKINLGTELFDLNSNFASSRFTPTVAGYYQLNFMVGVTATGITDGFAMIYQNGAEINRGNQLTIGSGAGVTLFSSAGSHIALFNGTTDYVEVYANVTGTSLSATYSRFSGHFIRSA
jgi:hypothetical protein